MLALKCRIWGTLAVFVVLAPTPAPAQTVANSFEDLQRMLKKGQTVFVTDDTGRETKGKVAEVSDDSLIINTPAPRTFARESITRVRHTDSLKNGALIGGGIGTGLAMWDYLIDPSEPGNAVVFAVGIGLGAAIGAGIDALVSRGGRALWISPLAGKDRQGVLVSVRF